MGDDLGEGLDEVEASQAASDLQYDVQRLKQAAQDLAINLVAEMRKAGKGTDFRVTSKNVHKRCELHPFCVSLEELSLPEEDSEKGPSLKAKLIVEIYVVEAIEGSQQEFYLESARGTEDYLGGLPEAVRIHGANHDHRFRYSLDGGDIL